MIQIGSLAEYLDAARVECRGMDREALLKRLAHLYRAREREHNRVESWKLSYARASDRPNP